MKFLGMYFMRDGQIWRIGKNGKMRKLMKMPQIMKAFKDK